MGLSGINIEALTTVTGIAWTVLMSWSLLFRFAERVRTYQDRMLAKRRMIDYDIEIQEYYWKCVREDLTPAQDQTDEEIKDLSPKQFERMICNLIEKRGMPDVADSRWERYNRGAKVTRKRGEDFDKVINN